MVYLVRVRSWKPEVEIAEAPKGTKVDPALDEMTELLKVLDDISYKSYEGGAGRLNMFGTYAIEAPNEEAAIQIALKTHAEEEEGSR